MIRVFCDWCHKEITGDQKVMHLKFACNEQPLMNTMLCDSCSNRVKPTVDGFLTTVKTMKDKSLVLV